MVWFPLGVKSRPTFIVSLVPKLFSRPVISPSPHLRVIVASTGTLAISRPDVGHFISRVTRPFRQTDRRTDSTMHNVALVGGPQ